MNLKNIRGGRGEVGGRKERGGMRQMQYRYMKFLINKKCTYKKAEKCMHIYMMTI